MTDPLPHASARWTLRHLIAATDFSVAGTDAVERATLLAREHGARLTLLNVVPESLWEAAVAPVANSIGVQAIAPGAIRQAAADRLQHRADQIATDEGLACAAVVTTGRPAAEVARVAAEAGADLIVVGAHGEHPVRDLMLGTTAQKLLRMSPCPVLVVKRAPPFAYRTVLAPTDFSPPSRAALEAAAALLPAATLHIAHAFELPYDGLMRFAAIDEATMARYHAAAAERLHVDLLAFADTAGIAVTRRVLHVAHGYPPTCIERWIDTIGADLVAIAAHGKSELERAFLGSVSLHTVLAATCDVLLLRGAGFA